MTDELRRLILFGLGAALGITVLVLSVPRLLGAAAGPETEILTELKDAEARGLELDVPGFPSKLIASRASFQRISVNVTDEKHAVITATLDFDGKVADTTVSSLGAERIPVTLEGSAWSPDEGWAPRLSRIVRTLEQRRLALERGDPSGLCSGRADAGEAKDLAELLRVEHRKLKATRWLIRSERDEVLITEEYRLRGTLPERPVDDVGSRRLLLQPGTTGEFCFPEGLM